MTKFVLNRRTMQMEPEQQHRPSQQEVFRKVKRINNREISAHNVTDAEINELITKVLKGIRNVMYLLPGHEQHKRLIEIFHTINREIPFGSDQWQR